MKISISVKAGSKVASVERSADGGYLVRVKAPAHEGRANEAVVEELSVYFKVPKSRITIVRGQTSKRKIVEIA